MRTVIGLCLGAFLALAAAPPAVGSVDAGRLCGIIAEASSRHALPPDFLARLIWKESRFDVRAVSPKGAQGVAQFMPGTAALRGLADPWDPDQAIEASAAYLADLRRRFGNLGLAAAAYNSGEGRVERWLAGESRLPAETLDYVLSITDRPADWFRVAAREVEPRPLDAARPFAEACARLPVMRTRAATPPWSVQLAGNLTRDGAMRSFERLRRRYPSVLASATPIVARNPHRVGQAYVVRVGAPTRESAGRLCAQLRALDGHCSVVRN